MRTKLKLRKKHLTLADIDDYTMEVIVEGIKLTLRILEGRRSACNSGNNWAVFGDINSVCFCFKSLKAVFKLGRLIRYDKVYSSSKIK